LLLAHADDRPWTAGAVEAELDRCTFCLPDEFRLIGAQRFTEDRRLHLAATQGYCGFKPLL